MALIDQVEIILNRLADQGWAELFKNITDNKLDIRSSNLSKELKKPLTIDRSAPGFEDFAPSANRAIEPGLPSHSLLYHALASPYVHVNDLGINGQDNQYASLEEFDIIENYIYSLAKDKVDLNGTVVAVFAYQYRVGSRSSHAKFADIAFSRTGVARVGTDESAYKAVRRSFWFESNEEGKFRVLPCRYGIFLAKKGIAGVDGSVLSNSSRSDFDEYLFPVYKLFEGDECIKDKSITQLNLLENHVNEKLKRIHDIPLANEGVPIAKGFDISKSPFVRNSENGGELVQILSHGSSFVLEPIANSHLVRTEDQLNSVSNKTQIVGFTVPRGNGNNRLSSSYMIPRVQNFSARLAPEYINIRQEADPNKGKDQPLNDLNKLSESEFTKKLRDGGYFAPHFVDDSCDGCIEASVEGLDEVKEHFPAFSLVTAPDFFPLADQSEVRQELNTRKYQPLSDERLPPNPSLKLPSNNSISAFSRIDNTTTAVVGNLTGSQSQKFDSKFNNAISYLTDSASGVFAPGWDVSVSADGAGRFFTSFGLGSPFPEDAKLCAAIQSFWPAVAPDNGRTFGNESGHDISLGNELPMLDKELGFHPKHERVLNNEVESYRGWDGEYGPFLEKNNGSTFINYVALERSDYVRHSIENRIRLDLTGHIQGEELVSRAQKLAVCQQQIQILGISTKGTSLFSFRKILNWPDISNDLSSINEPGYLIQFAVFDGDRMPTDDLSRVRRKVRKIHQCIITEKVFGHRENESGNFMIVRI